MHKTDARPMYVLVLDCLDTLQVLCTPIPENAVKQSVLVYNDLNL